MAGAIKNKLPTKLRLKLKLKLSLAKVRLEIITPILPSREQNQCILIIQTLIHRVASKVYPS